MSHVIFSDDRGRTWKLGDTVERHTEECQIVELSGGTLLLNMRNYWGRDGKRPDRADQRAVARSSDGGATWSPLEFDATLIEPVCQASLISVPHPSKAGATVLVFANPASKEARRNMTVRASFDEGKTWPVSRRIDKGSVAYSCLARLPSGRIGLLYERDDYRKITFTEVALDLGDAARPAATNRSAPTAPPSESRRYCLIFNCDGNAVFVDAKGDTQQWIKNLFEPLENSHVDALFWCDGAGGNTANYDSQVLELTGQRAGKVNAHLKRLIAEGNDPPLLVIREGRKRKLDVWYSFRINDVHDAFLPDERPTFKVQHPEWLIGEKQYGTVTSFPTALNFAVPEVRALKMRVIEELFRKYDFDGLEIDWMRSAPYFLPGEEGKHAHLLTEFLAGVRNHLNQRGTERGRPIRLGVRVDESLRSCRLNGFDVPAWIDRGLFDLVVLGSGVIDIEVEAIKKLAGPRGIPVYPCLYGWPSRYTPIPAELAAGIGLNYWQQGADGLYLFNWFPHAINNSERHGAYMTGLLKELGDPRALSRHTPLMFAADRGRPERAYQYNWLHCVLPVELPLNKPIEFTMRIGTSLAERKNAVAALRLAIEGLQAADQLRIELNGRPLGVLDRSQAGIVTAQVAPAQTSLGRNTVIVTLTERSAEAKAPRTLTGAGLHVK
jgi:hypothetical protein